MDEDLESFEADLKALTPAALSPALRARVEAALAESRPRPVRWNWVALATLPIAAAVAVLISFSGQNRDVAAGDTTRTAVSPADLLKPVSAENVLYAAQDEGLVTLTDGTTARRERLNFVDTITWQNSRTHASLTWSIPREEVRVVPVRYQ